MAASTERDMKNDITVVSDSTIIDSDMTESITLVKSIQQASHNSFKDAKDFKLQKSNRPSLNGNEALQMASSTKTNIIKLKTQPNK